MDNVSHRYSNEDTTTSMYLSFDAESTMSTACYKTLEAMIDVSVSSNIDNSVIQNKTGDKNNTLEVHDNSQNISPLKTVKKMEISDAKLNSPLKALPKNILKEYKVLCSTPSKDQLLKNIDVTRGSDATRCVELGLAFLGVDDEGPAFFPLPAIGLDEENKENALPDVEEVSSLSTCSSVEVVTSVIEKKMLNSISNIGSVIEEVSMEETKVNKDVKNNDVSVDAVDKTSDVYEANIIGRETTNMIELKKEIFETTASAKIAGVKFVDKIKETVESQKQNTPLVQEGKIAKKHKELAVKPKNTALSQNIRRSICEPSLLKNKPSRILDSNNIRRSLMPTCKKSAINMNAELEIPLLMSKMLKITDNSVETRKDEVYKKETENRKNPTTGDDKRTGISAVKKRTSLIPFTAANKRPFNFTQRMSVVVKTTLNSPARKIARRSVMGCTMPSLNRRSVIPKKITATDTSNIGKTKILPNETSASKTFSANTFGSNIQSNSKTLPPLKDTISNSTTTQRSSLYPPSTFLEKPKMCSIVGQSKQDNLYICNVCKEKFRIKSLLDAHKRSHESDNITPAFVKKPSPITQPASGTVLKNSNQCKHCDKKFVLLKALHIHLLQNCTKIPPSEKRKLQYTDLNHVEKAQLPNVFPHHCLQSSGSSTSSSVSNTPRYTLKQNNIITTYKSSTESSNENKDTQKIVNAEDPPNNTAPKVKKISAHAGIYKTPSKSVPCHLCRLTFKSILDYTNHNLSIHGSHKTTASYMGNAVSLPTMHKFT